MNIYHKQIERVKGNFKRWSRKFSVGFLIYNLIIMVLILLRSAGYFAPYLPLSINTIIFLCLCLSIFLLGVRSKAMFCITIIFWIFTATLKIIDISIWSERTAIYCFQALGIGILLFMYEVMKPTRPSK
jgi:hypothetical protein